MKRYLSAVSAFVVLALAPMVLMAMGEEKAPLTVEGATTIDAAGAKSLFDQGALFVDVRLNKDWEAGRIPGALHMELNTALSEEALSTEIKKDEALVMYCNGVKCLRSSKACTKAVSWGFGKVYYFRGGMPVWRAAGYPVE